MDILNLPVAAEGPVTEDTAIFSYREKKMGENGNEKEYVLEREREGMWV